MDTMCAQETDNQSAGHTEGETGIVEGQGHGQDAGTEWAFEQMSQSTAGGSAFVLVPMVHWIVVIVQLAFLRQVGSISQEREGEGENKKIS